MVLNMGPQHPSTHGVLRLLLELDGETIVKLPAGYRLSAHRHRKGIRSQDLPAGRHAHRPRRLPGAAFEQSRLLPGRRKAARPGNSAAGAVDARDAHRTDAPQQPPGVAGHARHRYRRDERVPLLLPRARRDSAHLRDVLRPAHDDQLFPHRRPGARAAARLAEARQEIHRHLPQPRRRVRKPAHQQPHLDRPHPGRRLHFARRHARSGRHRAHAARRRV